MILVLFFYPVVCGRRTLSRRKELPQDHASFLKDTYEVKDLLPVETMAHMDEDITSFTFRFGISVNLFTPLLKEFISF